jgi:hypothetical protein
VRAEAELALEGQSPHALQLPVQTHYKYNIHLDDDLQVAVRWEDLVSCSGLETLSSWPPPLASSFY